MAATSAAALAAQESQPDASPPTITATPDRVITPGSLFGTTVVAKPGSSLLYVSERRTAINIWALLTSYWSEMATIAVTLAAAILLLRLLRWRRVPGQPHCRKCNYQLTALAAAERCPECGSLFAKRKPVIGRDTRAWIALAALIAALMPAAYLVCLRACPRVGPWSQWQQWWSLGLYEFASSRQIKWLADHGQTVSYLEEVDASDGQRKRVVLINVVPTYGLPFTAVGTKVVGFQQGRTASPMFDLVEIETATGQTQRTPIPLNIMHGFTLAAYCIPTRTAYFLSIENESLYSINAAGGTLTKLADVDFHKTFHNLPAPATGAAGQSYSFKPPMTCGIPPDHRRFVVTEADGQRSIQLGQHHSRGFDTHEVVLYDAVQGRQEAVLGERIALQGLASSPDGHILFAAVAGRGIVAWNLEQPEQEPIVVADDDVAKSLEHLEISPNGRFLGGTSWTYSSAQPTTALHVYDLSRRDWVANLSVPSGWMARSCFFTGDLQHLVCSTVRSGAALGQQTLIYDVMAQLPDAAAETPAPTYAALAASGATPWADSRQPKVNLRRVSLSDLLQAVARPGACEAEVEEIVARIGNDEFSEACYSTLFALCGRGDPDALPLTDAWKA